MFTQENQKENQVTYVKIRDGKLVVQVDASTNGAISRINKVGREVFEQFYNQVTGYISNIDLHENNFGEWELSIGIKGSDDQYAVLSFNADSSYARSFYQQIFQIDPAKQLVFNPWMKITENGKISRLYLNYADKSEKIEPAYPQGTPEVKFVDTKKGKVIDPVSKAAFTDFIEEKLQEYIDKHDLKFERKESTDLGPNVDTTPLNAKELADLKELKKANKGKARVVDADDPFAEDDFLSDL